MDTKTIELEETTVEEFWDLEDHWGRDRPIYRHEMYGRVRNPIIQESLDYEKLICKLIQIPTFAKAKVRKGKGWKDITPETASKPEHLRQQITELARLAEQEPLKQHYLDLELRDRGASAIIEFREIENMIVGYSIRGNKFSADLFTIKPKRSDQFTYANGIWAPV